MNYSDAFKDCELGQVLETRENLRHERSILEERLQYKKEITQGRYMCRSTTTKIGNYTKTITELNKVIANRLNAITL